LLTIRLVDAACTGVFGTPLERLLVEVREPQPLKTTITPATSSEDKKKARFISSFLLRVQVIRPTPDTTSTSDESIRRLHTYVDVKGQTGFEQHAFFFGQAQLRQIYPELSRLEAAKEQADAG
jgi:hypothetical protein